MPRPQTRKPHHVLMLAFENCQVLDVTGPLEILAAANDLNPAAPAYRLTLVAKRKGPFMTTSGLKLVADAGFDELAARERASVDTFMIAGGDGTLDAMRDKAFLAFAKAAARQAPRVATVCSGSIILAATGLLNGRRATTHWNNCNAMARGFPEVTVERDAIYVRDGKFWTSAGVTAGMDLAIALVEQDCGREAALSIARRHVLYMMRPGGQSQFSAALAAQAAPGGKAAKAVAYALQNLTRDLGIAALAEAAGLSERTLVRAFRSELKTTPAAFVRDARLDMARRKLAEPGVSAARVARDCGFMSEEVMRRAFQRRLGVSPTDYRARFVTSARGGSA